MAKKTNTYYCNACGYETNGWLGKCPKCSSWNTFEKVPLESSSKKVQQAGVSTGWLQDLLEEDLMGNIISEGENSNISSSTLSARNKLDSKIVNLSEVDAKAAEHFPSGISELDRVLGGGFVPGSLVLVGGDPGIGKSTLLIQASSKVANSSEVLYVCGEESVQQVKFRADRLDLNTKGIKLTNEIVFENLAPIIQKLKPKLCVVDSIQTVYSEQSASAPGSVSQIRDCSAGFLRLAKSLGTAIILVGHVTKDGNIAGPRVLEHMVDTVIYFEGDRYSSMRLVRAVKNRFGATNEVGLFDMSAQGLIPVTDATAKLLSGRPENVSGSALSCILEGSRAMIIEIQALLNPSSFASPMRVTQGLDRNRVSMLMALSEKKLGIGLNNMDAFLNVVNGFKADDPSTDLALICAIISSFKEKPIKEKLLISGEVGLTGEVRAIAQVEKRVIEASELGFKYYLLPSANSKQVKKLNLQSDIEIIFVDTITDAIDIIW